MRAFRFAGTTIVFVALTASTRAGVCAGRGGSAGASGGNRSAEEGFRCATGRSRVATRRARRRAARAVPAAEPVTPTHTDHGATASASRRAGRRRTERGAAGVRQRVGRFEDLQPRHGGHRQLSRRNRRERGATRSRRWSCPNPKLSFQAIVDPYARADFFLSFGEEGVELEEGYITFPTLPGGLLIKVGKMRAAFGKVNTLHKHVLPWTDRPLVTDNLVGGEDGIDDAGISVARLIPNPWLFLEATGQVFRGDSDDCLPFDASGAISATSATCAATRTSPSRRNLDLGVSYARGHNPSGVVGRRPTVGRFMTTALRRRRDVPVAAAATRRSTTRSSARPEFVWSRRDQPDGLQRAFGFYVSGDYQFGRRWFAGVRFDRSDRADRCRSARHGPVADR